MNFGVIASIRAPRRLSRIGPLVRSPMARSRARPTAGGSGVRTVFPVHLEPTAPLSVFGASG